MSLSSLLNGRKPEQKAFQQIMRELIPNKKDFTTLSGNTAFTKSAYTTHVPYQLEKHYNASVIGTAFDYLARIMIAQKVKRNREGAYTNLVAEHGFYILDRFTINHPKIQRKIEKQYNKSWKRFRKYSRTKKCVKDIILDACYFAKLERIYRSGMPPMNLLDPSFFEGPDEEVINDLERLCNTFEETFLPYVKPTSHVVYNPNFGVASSLVGGADADVYIDGCLYDFKTGKPIGYKWQDIAQIVGYYLLNDIAFDLAKIDKDSNEGEYPPYLHMQKLAIFRGRYGEIEYIDTSYFTQASIRETKLKLIDYFLSLRSFNQIYLKKRHLLEELKISY